MRSSLRTSTLLGLIVMASSLSACGKKPSEAQCEEFADHFVKLLEESRDKPDARIRRLAQNQRQALVDHCVEDGTVAEIECVLAQPAIGDVEANCK